MNLSAIAEVINSNIPDNYKEDLIIGILSRDKNTIPMILKILSEERERIDDIMTNMNVLLSKADIVLDEPNLNKDNFVQKEILDFYTKYKSDVGHCFKDIFKK